MEKYPFLRRAVGIVKVLAWVVLVIGIIGSIVAAASAGTYGAGGAVVVAILGILYSVVAWIFLLATSEIFRLLIDVEENTRKAAEGQR